MAQSQIGSRLVYQNAKAIMKKNGFDPSYAVLSQSYLRTEVALNTTQTQYRFPIVINDNFVSVTNTSVLLNLQDVFVVSRVRLSWGSPSSSTASNFPLSTYPDPTIFTGANVASSLYQFYNGFLQVTVNNKVVVPKYRLAGHYAVPTQQASTAPYYAANTVPFISEQYGNSTGWVVIEPNLLLSGAKQTDWTVTIPNALTAVLANSRAVFEIEGLLAQNVTSVR